MAQSKSFFGMRRGSTKTLTFQVNKGKQITKDRVYEVSNPKTFYQMKQRASFSNAVKFYKHAVANFFKFAFEDKKQDESDYNAFMRYNVSRSTVISADASKSDVYPALGNWLLTKGSIPSAVITPSGSTAFDLAVTENELSTTSWSEVSRLIASKYDLVDGDVVTLVHVVAMGATANNMPALAIPSALEGVKWVIEQRIIGATNEDDTIPFGGTLNANALSFAFNNPSEIAYAQGFAVIFSRPSSASLRVSTAEIVPSLTAKTILYNSMKREWVKAALSTWEATGDAVLQGSLLKEGQTTENLAITAMNFNYPLSKEEIDNGNPTISYNRTLSKIDITDGTTFEYVDEDGELMPFAMSSLSSTSVKCMIYVEEENEDGETDMVEKEVFYASIEGNNLKIYDATEDYVPIANIRAYNPE